ncbi:5'-nucleotidase C-terminal domain-containing protein [Gulosibacter sp. ACHW.36C]|uniref:5'-nucleotidase C-terminal domain-containing protein n=1 Tax=Gulosibacter sediminis TaxID=1729695 RepID=A0ABY4MXI9_9MICO|nr:5'-nucleotidase C-terminal domain-containing protein [Gulosibacter sediminis]UQN15141.1 5'-nucleotidase C-terminal domain-containing protein [Gulosibacter sediminis]
MAKKSPMVKGGVAATLGLALAATAFVAPANAEALNTGEVIQPTAGTTQINLIGFNDFHGRITKVDAFAANVLQVQDTFGADNSIIIGNGDQVGASEFESSVAGDQPSKDALVALGVDSYTSGNHEFDKGQEDALAIRDTFGTLLAANVIKADGTPLLDAYSTFEVAGHTVAVVGAVTQSTASGVSPAGIEGLSFTDPVDAVNDVAAQLSDGDESNGEADIIIASYHEGGPSSGSYDDNSSNETFAKMATETSADVDAIYEAHTHQTYNYETNIDGKIRQVVQAGQYAENVGQIVLDVDADGNVVSSSSSVVPTFLEDGETPRVDASTLSADSQAVYNTVVGIQEAALAEAEVLGAEQIGVVEEDITRAKTYDATGAVTVEDNRAQESTLGSVVADSMMLWAQSVGTEALDADLSIMNPGGMRADIAGDGTLTYKDGQVVLPFVNNLSVVSITGAELKNVLEEQWQLQADGTVPSRPYLQLGLSSNVDYSYTGSTSDDPLTTQGSHITSVYIDGVALDDAQVYKVVMPSFLAAGGDNFLSLNNNEGVYDTGSVDLDAFVQYVESLPGTLLEPEQTRNGFQIDGYFGEDGAAPSIEAGAEQTITVTDVDLHSLDLVANTTVEVLLDGNVIGEGTVTGSTLAGETTTADVTFTVPADTAAGDYTIQVVAQPSGSTVNLPLTVTAATETTPPTTTPPTTPSTETPAPTPSETESQEPQLVTEQEHYTTAESADGVNYVGVNFAANEAVDIAISVDGGDAQSVDSVLADADGTISGQLTYQTVDQETGAVIEDNLPWPAGTYTIVATQGDLSATVTFTVGDETGAATDGGSTDGTSTVPAAGNNGSGDQLATTGANETAMFAGIAAGVIALALGGTLMLLRRRNNDA